MEPPCSDQARAAPRDWRAAPRQRLGGWQRCRGPHEWRQGRRGCSDAAPSPTPEELVTEPNLERALERDSGAGRGHLRAHPPDGQRARVKVARVVLVKQVVDAKPEDHVLAWSVVKIQIDDIEAVRGDRKTAARRNIAGVLGGDREPAYRRCDLAIPEPRSDRGGELRRIDFEQRLVRGQILALLQRTREGEEPRSGVIGGFEFGAPDARGRDVLILLASEREWPRAQRTVLTRGTGRNKGELDEILDVVLEHIGFDAQCVLGGEQVVLPNIDADFLGLPDFRFQPEVLQQDERRRLRVRAIDEDLGYGGRPIALRIGAVNREPGNRRDADRQFRGETIAA